MFIIPLIGCVVCCAGGECCCPGVTCGLFEFMLSSATRSKSKLSVKSATASDVNAEESSELESAEPEYFSIFANKTSLQCYICSTSPFDLDWYCIFVQPVLLALPGIVYLFNEFFWHYLRYICVSSC